MNNLPFGWKRKPLRNCPLCKGEGEILWQLYNAVPPELVCVGWKIPPRKGPKLAESKVSKVRRAVWMEFAHRKSDCACVTMHRINFPFLKNIATHKKRVVDNVQPEESELNDPLDDLFPGPYIYPEFLK